MIPDPVSDKKLALLFRDVAHAWLELRNQFFNAHGLQIRVTRGLSSYPNQLELYASGRMKGPSGAWYVANKRKIVTDALPGHSYHNFGLAVDSCFMGDDPYLEKLPAPQASGLWKEFGLAVKDCGMSWGGDWNGELVDRPHAEISIISLAKARELFEAKGILQVYSYCASLVDNCGREFK